MTDDLRKTLAAHSLDADIFEALPSNCYEHALARAGADVLGAFYDVIFAPGLNLAEKVDRSPPWPDHTPQAGAKPSDSLLSKIIIRWRAEKALNSFAEADRFVNRLKAKLEKLPSAKAAPVTDTLFNLLGQELLDEKFRNETPVGLQLRAMDRLLAKQRLEMDAEQAKLARAKFERETTEMVLKWANDARVRDISASAGTDADKIAALGRLMFGDTFEALHAPKTAQDAPAPSGGSQ